MMTRNRYLSALAALLLTTASAYADVKISDLPAGTTLAGAEPIPAVQSGVTVKTTPAAIANYVQSVQPDVDLETDVTGTLPVANGGTGATTVTGLLRGAGTAPVTGGAVVSLTSEVSGLLPVSNGGTGANTLTGVVKGSGGAALTAGNVSLTSEVTGTLPVGNGGTGLASAAVDTVPMGQGGTAAMIAVSVPDCTDSGGNHLNFDATGNTFSCGTTAGPPSGTVGVANGGTGINTAAADAVIMGSGTTTPMQAVNMPDCTDTGGQHVNYNATTNAFSCGTSVPGGGLTETFTDISATVTVGGFSSPTKTVWCNKIGRNIVLHMDISGTSNATTFTVTAIPAGCRPGRFTQGLINATNNGSGVVGIFTMSTGGAMDLFSSVGSAAWTASGAKGLPGVTIQFIGP